MNLWGNFWNWTLQNESVVLTRLILETLTTSQFYPHCVVEEQLVRVSRVIKPSINEEVACHFLPGGLIKMMTQTAVSCLELRGSIQWRRNKSTIERSNLFTWHFSRVSNLVGLIFAWQSVQTICFQASLEFTWKHNLITMVISNVCKFSSFAYFSLHASNQVI